ncbi:MAG: hypothetical protein C4526_04890 [Nitrospiraceae bacterium]|nr:MAG: hypothetical protein C4526_04890 [Nitrospiraceae bacterium]
MRIGEHISVMVSFGPRYRVRPVRFKWSGKTFEVKEITYMWKTSEGQSLVHHFSVTDGKTLYELSFDTSSMIWRIEGVEA